MPSTLHHIMKQTSLKDLIKRKTPSINDNSNIPLELQPKGKALKLTTNISEKLKVEDDNLVISLANLGIKSPNKIDLKHRNDPPLS